MRGFFPALLVFAVGLVVSVAPLTTTIMTSLPDERDGLASGVNKSISRIAGLLAIAAFGPVLFFVFQSGVINELDAAGISQQTIVKVTKNLDQLAAMSPPKALMRRLPIGFVGPSHKASSAAFVS